MEFAYTVKADKEISIVTLSGNLIDKTQTTELLNEIDTQIEEGKKKFLLDLGELKYMNSSGLNALIVVLTKARKAGGEAVIANLSQKVKELFLITKLNTVFTVVESTEDAMEQLSK